MKRKKKERGPTLRERVGKLEAEVKRLSDLVAAILHPVPNVQTVPGVSPWTPRWPWVPQIVEPFVAPGPTIVSYGPGTVSPYITTGTGSTTGSCVGDFGDQPGVSWFTGTTLPPQFS